MCVCGLIHKHSHVHTENLLMMMLTRAYIHLEPEQLRLALHMDDMRYYIRKQPDAGVWAQRKMCELVSTNTAELSAVWDVMDECGFVVSPVCYRCGCWRDSSAKVWSVDPIDDFYYVPGGAWR